MENKKNKIEKRKQNQKQKTRIQQNVQPSLSWFEIELPKKQMKSLKIMKTSNLHMLINMHSNLKFILNNPLNGKYVKQFRKENYKYCICILWGRRILNCLQLTMWVRFSFCFLSFFLCCGFNIKIFAKTLWKELVKSDKASFK